MTFQARSVELLRVEGDVKGSFVFNQNSGNIVVGQNFTGSIAASGLSNITVGGNLAGGFITATSIGTITSTSGNITISSITATDGGIFGVLAGAPGQGTISSRITAVGGDIVQVAAQKILSSLIQASVKGNDPDVGGNIWVIHAVQTIGDGIVFPRIRADWLIGTITVDNATVVQHFSVFAQDGAVGILLVPGQPPGYRFAPVQINIQGGAAFDGTVDMTPNAAVAGLPWFTGESVLKLTVFNQLLMQPQATTWSIAGPDGGMTTITQLVFSFKGSQLIGGKPVAAVFGDPGFSIITP